MIRKKGEAVVLVVVFYIDKTLADSQNNCIRTGEKDTNSCLSVLNNNSELLKF